VHESEGLSLAHNVTIERIENVAEYISRMRFIRDRADDLGVVPLYHFCSPTVLPMILEGGLRMSTQGQVSGGRATEQKARYLFRVI
jgi:hypothetical protein